MLNGEIFIFLMLTNGLYDFVRFEAQSTNKAIFWTCQELVIVYFQNTIHRPRDSLNSIAVTCDIVSLENYNTALTRGTDDILTVFHQFQSIKLFVNTVWNRIQFLFRIGAFLYIINCNSTVHTAGNDVSILRVKSETSNGVALWLGFENALGSTQVPHLDGAFIVSWNEDVFIHKLASVNWIFMCSLDNVRDLSFSIDEPQSLILRTWGEY